jgi:hypothetical protein
MSSTCGERWIIHTNAGHVCKFFDNNYVQVSNLNRSESMEIRNFK